MKPTRVLFLLKKRGEYYNPHHPPHPPHPPHPNQVMVQHATQGWPFTNWTGLRNSVAYVVDLLQTLGIEAAFERLDDDNSIDRAVTQFQPTHAIIEALWVRPEKLKLLTRLHPQIRWNVRMHSEVPFLSNEGIAIEWIFAYLQSLHVTISANSLRAEDDFEAIFKQKISYTPNFYPLFPLEPRKGLPSDNVIDIGCFGAIRPMKNQLMQAVAAIDWANGHQRQIRFHINSDRIEMGGAQVLKNIRALFRNVKPSHTLVEHPWMDRADFMKLVRLMDLGMQVSYSETFNIVSADFAVANVPLVVSPEVSWVAKMFQADPNSRIDIVHKLNIAWAGRHEDLQKLNYAGLQAYDAASEVTWPQALMEMR